MNGITEIRAKNIVPGNNDRKVFKAEDLATLAESIKTNGLAQPITVRSKGRWFEIVCGERRFRAMRDVLKWEFIPCHVRELTDAEASAVMLAENTARVDLNPMEEARAYRARRDQFNSSVEEIAQLAGVSVERVKRRLALLTLIEPVQELIAKGQMPLGHAEAMGVLDAARQQIAVRVLQSRDGIPLATFRQVVGDLLAQQSTNSLFDLEDFWVKQVESGAGTVRRGKHAVTGAPKRADLPAVDIKPTDDTGAILDRFIHQLILAGRREEAAALGNVYEALVHSNYVCVPVNSLLLSGGEKE